MTALQNEELRQQLHDARNELHRVQLQRDGLADAAERLHDWVERWVDVHETLADPTAFYTLMADVATAVVDAKPKPSEDGRRG